MSEALVCASAHRVFDWLAAQSGNYVVDVGGLALELEEPQYPEQVIQGGSPNAVFDWRDERLIRSGYTAARMKNNNEVMWSPQWRLLNKRVQEELGDAFLEKP